MGATGRGSGDRGEFRPIGAKVELAVGMGKTILIMRFFILGPAIDPAHVFERSEVRKT